jgi:hypothetical protein
LALRINKIDAQQHTKCTAAAYTVRSSSTFEELKGNLLLIGKLSLTADSPQK